MQKDSEIGNVQAAAKKKQLELETQLKREIKKSGDQIAKLNKKLNKQETLAAKFFNLEGELTSLRSQLLLKDKEIFNLKDQLKKSGGAIPEENESEFEYDEELERQANAKPEKRAASPD